MKLSVDPVRGTMIPNAIKLERHDLKRGEDFVYVEEEPGISFYSGPSSQGVMTDGLFRCIALIGNNASDQIHYMAHINHLTGRADLAEHLKEIVDNPRKWHFSILPGDDHKTGDTIRETLAALSSIDHELSDKVTFYHFSNRNEDQVFSRNGEIANLKFEHLQGDYNVRACNTLFPLRYAYDHPVQQMQRSFTSAEGDTYSREMSSSVTTPQQGVPQAPKPAPESAIQHQPSHPTQDDVTTHPPSSMEQLHAILCGCCSWLKPQRVHSSAAERRPLLSDVWRNTAEPPVDRPENQGPQFVAHTRG
jgi:hypothetical protein